MASQRICSVEGCGKPHYAKSYCNPHWAKWHKYGDPLAGRTATPKGAPLAWLISHATYKGNDCLLWPFAKCSWGYGDLWVDRKHFRANRYMCELAHGAPPSPTHEALHTCGNGHLACVNPKHLRWGTSKDNSADALRHGTILRGERVASSKLRKDDVCMIRYMISQGVPIRNIAGQFGISPRTVSDIKRRKIWGWLT